MTNDMISAFEDCVMSLPLCNDRPHTNVMEDFVAMNSQKLPHFKSKFVCWDGEYDESLLDSLDCSLSAQEWQPSMDDNGLGSFDPFEVNTPTRKSYYPFVDKKNGIIGGL